MARDRPLSSLFNFTQRPPPVASSSTLRLTRLTYLLTYLLTCPIQHNTPHTIYPPFQTPLTRRPPIDSPASFTTTPSQPIFPISHLPSPDPSHSLKNRSSRAVKSLCSPSRLFLSSTCLSRYPQFVQSPPSTLDRRRRRSAAHRGSADHLVRHIHSTLNGNSSP